MRKAAALNGVNPNAGVNFAGATEQLRRMRMVQAPVRSVNNALNLNGN